MTTTPSTPEGLPNLPPYGVNQEVVLPGRGTRIIRAFTADQMQAYALAAIAAQQEKNPDHLDSGVCGGVTQWQPIETAPRDGSTVIVGRDMGSFGFVRGYGRFEGDPRSFLCGWISSGFTDPPGNLGLAYPSHWMPLPPPLARGSEAPPGQINQDSEAKHV
ncbi:MAG: hypothetical protein V4858_17005 [Pseudomonadota bacterium]